MADVILFATADWNTPYWTNKQHSARHLAKKGFRVLYVESIGLRAPSINRKDITRLWKRFKRGILPPRKVEKNIWVFSPLLIPFKHHWPWIRWTNQRILSWQLKKFIRKNQFRTPLIWTYHPFILEALNAISYDKLIYHCVDDLAAVPGIAANAFKEEEKKLLACCQLVFTTSTALHEHCEKFATSYYFPNVVEAEHFKKAREKDNLPPELEKIPIPRIGYIGALSDYKVDFELILSIAKQHPEWHWIFIGEEREGQENESVKALKTFDNVHFLGYRPYSVLPHYLRGLDVATLPTLLNSYTRAMFPMKYFEYLAAGIPIVSTPLEFTKTYTQGIKIGSDTASFINGIQQQLQRGKLTEKEAEEYVADNTWEARLTKMLEKIYGTELP